MSLDSGEDRTQAEPLHLFKTYGTAERSSHKRFVSVGAVALR